MDLPDVIWYNYKGIIVSGNTLVKENDVWLRIYESSYSKKIEDKHFKFQFSELEPALVDLLKE
jgi:NAD dependent epimerase/dehydratase family enzyme